MDMQEPALIKLLTFEECAAQIGTSRLKIEKLARAGELTLVKLGPRTLRIESRSLANYLRRKLAEAKRAQQARTEATRP